MTFPSSCSSIACGCAAGLKGKGKRQLELWKLTLSPPPPFFFNIQMNFIPIENVG